MRTPVVSFGPVSLLLCFAAWPFIIVKEKIEFRRLYGRWH